MLTLLLDSESYLSPRWCSSHQPRWKSPFGSTTPDTSNSQAAARIEESRFDVYSFKTVILMKGHGNSGDVNLQPTYLG